MKRIINGLRYDTEKAIEIGYYEYGSYPGSGDFSHWDASLYKTPRSGRYFLHGEGGAMTQFAQHSSGNTRCGGEKIIPLTKEEALEWAEHYLPPGRIEEFFGDDIEDA